MDISIIKKIILNLFTLYWLEIMKQKLILEKKIISCYSD